jgi:hypothetical protein
MPSSNSFERLIQKALETHDYPPIPASILQKWQPTHSEKGAKWLWILPSLVFVIGISVGVWLAPLGLSNAFISMKMALFTIWNSIPSATLAWALALVIAAMVFTFDGLRRVLFRFR